MEMNKIIITTIFLFFISQGFSQNLVKNPSFEENSVLPKDTRDFRYVDNWTLIKVAASYFHEYAPSFPGFTFTPTNNIFGYQEPHSGLATSCITLVDNDGLETGGLIQGELSEALKSETCYYAEVYLSCADKFVNFTSNFEFIFSDTAFTGTVKNEYFQKLIPNISNPLDNFIEDKINWVKVSGVFKAKGGEKYILIGNPQKTSTMRINKSSDLRCVYFIDDVSVVELPFCPEDEFSVDSLMTFNDLNFETGKSVILESSYDELDKMVTFLTLFEEYNIQISGHTDNVGTSEFNQKLSEDRAKAVCDYLISKGILSERLTSTGYGDTKPIADNSTDEGKSKNRRVEFIITKK